MQKKLSEEIILIVGAGVSGLTAAYKLAQAGEKCLLVEKSDKIGGMCRTYNVDGITFDLGPHLFFHNPDSAPEQFMYDLLKDEETVLKKSSYSIYVSGKYWKQPVKPWHLLLYPLQYKKDFFLSRLSKGKENQFHPDSLAYALSKKIGYSCYSDLYEPLLYKKTHVSGRLLHRDWLHRADRGIDNRPERMRNINHLKALWHLMKIVFFPKYYYPLKGFGIFPEILFQNYKDAGGTTLMNCGPITFEMENNKISRANVGGNSILTKSIVWTGSVNELNEILGENKQCAGYVDTLIVFLTFKRKQRYPRPFVYIYYPEKDISFDRLYFPDSIYGKRSRLDREGVCVEINNSSITRLQNDEKIVERVIIDLEKMGLFNKKNLREHHLIRLKDCMPVHKLDYEAELEGIFNGVHHYRNLYSVGRKGGYFFCQTPAAINQGLKIASHILENKE